MFKNILVAVAGYHDPATGKIDSVLETIMERNIRYGCELAKSMGSKLTLIHVIVLPRVIDPTSPVNPKIFEDAGKEIIEEARKIAKDHGVEPETVSEYSYGNPAPKIIQVAEEGKYDLVIISSRGHSYLRTLITGSVCDAVTKHAPCPVLVIR